MGHFLLGCAIRGSALECIVTAGTSVTEIGFGLRSASGEWSGSCNGAYSGMKQERNVAAELQSEAAAIALNGYSARGEPTVF